MALLTNNRSGAGYLAVELTIDKRFQPSMPFTRGPVISWDLPDEVYEELREVQEALLADWEESASDWPPIDRVKVGWLNCTTGLWSVRPLSTSKVSWCNTPHFGIGIMPSTRS